MSRRSRRTTEASLEAWAPPRPTQDTSGIEMRPFAPKGSQLRVNARKAARAFYAPAPVGAPSTTRQAEVLNTAVIAAPTDAEGIAIGQDVLSWSVVAHDPFTAYEKGHISSATVVVIGDVGQGKSSLIKTVYLARPLVLQRRRVVVIDRKDKGGAGEYAGLCEKFEGSTRIDFRLDGGGSRINVLDPVIAGASGVSGQLRLLQTLAELARGNDGVLDEWELQALRHALGRTLRAEQDSGRCQTLTEVVGQLHNLDPARMGLRGAAADRIYMAAISTEFLLGSLLEEYSGLFDGETTPGVDLGSRLTSFDISQLPMDGPAASLVVATVNTWMLGRLRRERGWFTNRIDEEGWDVVAGPVGRQHRAQVKLHRGLGLSEIISFHKLADLPVDSPAVAFLQEAQTVHIFGQARVEDQERCASTFNLEPGSAASIGQLPIGDHLLKIGTRPEVHIRHVRSDLEAELTNTDEAMTTTGRRSA